MTEFQYRNVVASYSPWLARHGRDYLGYSNHMILNPEAGCIKFDDRMQPAAGLMFFAPFPW